MFLPKLFIIQLTCLSKKTAALQTMSLDNFAVFCAPCKSSVSLFVHYQTYGSMVGYDPV